MTLLVNAIALYISIYLLLDSPCSLAFITAFTTTNHVPYAHYGRLRQPCIETARARGPFAGLGTHSASNVYSSTVTGCIPGLWSVINYAAKRMSVDIVSVTVLLARRKSAKRGDAVILAGCPDAGKTAILSAVRVHVFRVCNLS